MSNKTITMTGYAMRYDETDPDPAFLTAMPTVEDGDEDFIFTPATLVIGPGKVFTEEEHEAEVQCRMKAFLKDVLDNEGSYKGRYGDVKAVTTREITDAAVKHNIEPF